jgi:hypothetical protein
LGYLNPQKRNNMNSFWFHETEIYTSDRNARFVIISNRLAKLIIAKSLKGEWIHDYFAPRIDIVFLKSFRCIAIGTHGLMLGVKKEPKNEQS